MDVESDKDDVKNYLIGSTTINQSSVLFDFGNVIVQRNYFENECVRILSGGFYCLAEFVGKGMLTSTIQGEQFAAPPSKLILRTIRELCYSHLKGTLIIVPANSGNVLNFGLATVRALNDNLRVKFLPISDDCWEKNVRKMSKKGLSAIILLGKIAGAMSERRESLIDIYNFSKAVLKNTMSCGFKFDVSTYNQKKCICTIIPTETEKNQIKKIKLSAKTTSELCKDIVGRILFIKNDNADFNQIGKLNLNPEDEVVVLLNNNDVLDKYKEMDFIKNFVDMLSTMMIRVIRFYAGNYINCLGGINLTVTIMKVHSKKVLEYLDDPCEASGWRKVNQYNQVITKNSITGNLQRKDRLAPPIRGPKLSDQSANILLFSLQFACDALISCEKQLNIIDAEKGDGDSGTRLRNTCDVILKRMKINKINTYYPFTFFESLSKLLEATVGGTAGCIYSILFEAAAFCFGEYPDDYEITPSTWLKALQSASVALKNYGDIEYGDGTMYDPIEGCCNVVQKELESGSNFIDAFGKGVSAAEDIAQLTKKHKFKYPDSGAHAVGIWMRAAYEGVKLRCPVDQVMS